MPADTAFQIRAFRNTADYAACVELQKDTWGRQFSELVPPAILMAAQKVGGVSAGAFGEDGTLLGFVFGITGWEAGRPVHWSDMLAVRPELRDMGIGSALKQWQRDRLLERGVDTVYWTFDPLESKNAYVNFAHLGIVAREYHRDLYGQTDSPLHAGIGTDRLVAVWRIGSARVARRLAREESGPPATEAARWPLVNPVRVEDGVPRCEAPALDVEGAGLRVAIPADIQALKAGRPDLALEWRECTRAALQRYLDGTREIVEVVREGPWSSYVLRTTALDS